jgi:acyl-coenzyme A synthetase/AMP-(fatty) acid ligase
VLNPSYIHQPGYAKIRTETRALLKEKLARHQIPQKIKVVTDSLPKNAMGKGKLAINKPSNFLFAKTVAVNKKALVEQFFPAQI